MIKSNQDKQFKSQTIYDLVTYKEFMKGMRNVIPLYKVVQIIIIFQLVCFIFAILFTGEFLFFLEAALVWMIIYVAATLVNRNGDMQYKQMLSTNNGKTPRYFLTISDGTIDVSDNNHGNHMTYEFEKIRGIGETKNLIFFLLDYRMGVMIDKRTLTGGTVEELIQYMLSSCPNLKKHKVQSGRGGRIRKNMIIALVFTGFLLSLIQWISIIL